MKNKKCYKYNINTFKNIFIKIFNIYKDKTIEVVKNNPYQLIEDIDDSHYWVKDGRTCDDNGENCTIENNASKSCLAFQIYSGEEAVTYGYRSEFNDALCKK